MSAAQKQLKIADYFKRVQPAKRLSSVLSPTETGDSVPQAKRPKNVDSEQIESATDENVPSSPPKVSPNVSAVANVDKDDELFKSESIYSSLVDPGWRRILRSTLLKPFMSDITGFLDKQYKENTKIFPPRNLIFNAFNLTPFRKIRVVLIGQDPYHNDGQAHGLCFSVPHGTMPPPSLKNIYKELESEFPDFKTPSHGCLEKWAEQGVFMLNATLTVEAHKANSHSSIGWQKFTDSVIRIISDQSAKPCVFLLWGGFAQKKASLINSKRHRIIMTAHPSPLSYHRFRGCACFGKTNDALKQLNREPIDWNCL